MTQTLRMAEREEKLISKLPASKISRRALAHLTSLKLLQLLSLYSAHCAMLPILVEEKQHPEKCPLTCAFLLSQNAWLWAQLPAQAEQLHILFSAVTWRQGVQPLVP